jgi:hypothetical protein
MRNRSGIPGERLNGRETLDILPGGALQKDTLYTTNFAHLACRHFVDGVLSDTLGSACRKANFREKGQWHSQNPD